MLCLVSLMTLIANFIRDNSSDTVRATGWSPVYVAGSTPACPIMVPSSKRNRILAFQAGDGSSMLLGITPQKRKYNLILKGD